MRRISIVVLSIAFQACGFFGQNVSNSTSGSGPLASFTIEQVSTKKVILNASDSTSFLDAVDGKAAGYLEYQWTFQDLDGDYLSQKIEFAPAGNLADGNQSLVLVNGGTLQIKEKQHAPSIQYYAPTGGVGEITVAACLEVRDANGIENTSPATGLICQNITLESAQTQEPDIQFYSIGGVVAGLTGTLVLQNNGGNNLTITSNGGFTFSTEIEEDQTYDVTVLTQPAGLTCSIANGAGTATTDVGDVTIICSSVTYTVGGTVSGLTGTLILENNNGDDETIIANGAYTFDTPVASGATYLVGVSTQPTGQTCVVSNGNGTITSNVINADITCTTNTHSVGGSVSGLTGTLVLQNNGGDDETIIANGAYTFDTQIDFGTLYNVTVLTQPVGQTCVVGNGNGTISGNVTNTNIVCATNTYSIGGNISGLVGTIVLQNNGGDDEFIAGDGAFTFDTPISYGDAYSASVAQQPTGQTCIITNDNGTTTSNVINITVTCTTNTHTVGGTVSGLTGSLVLQNNGGDDEIINADGAYTFDTEIEYGTLYNATVLTQPVGQTCLVSNDSGTITGNVINVNVVCTTNTHTIGGTVSGLTGTLVLQNNAGDDKIIISNGVYTFSTSINYGSGYSATILTQPAGQTCLISNDNGTITGNVTNIDVSCSTSTHTIGGTVSGLTGTLVLQNNAGDDETINANGAYTFNTSINFGSGYNVTIFTQPSGQTCIVGNGSGTVSGNVTNVNVSCDETFSLGGTFTGIPNGSTVTLIDNETGQTLIVPGVVSSTGNFTFTTEYELTDSFDVAVQSQTSTLACTLVNDTATFTGLDISNLELNCATKLCNSVESKYIKFCSPTAADAAGGANMTAISNNFAVVSTHLEDANSDTTPSNNALADSGGVFVYQRDDASGYWYAVDFLKASNLATTDWFGYSVALDGANKRIIVGARQEDSNSAANQANNALSAAGAAYIFERDTTGNWAQVAYLKHPSPDATDNCGTTVAIDGDYAVMGCPDEDSNTDANPANDGASASGCAIVYQRSGGGVWSQFDFLKATNLSNTDQFGLDVAISGDYIIVGSPGEDSNNDVLPGNALSSASGAAYIYHYDGVSNWAQEDFLKASNLDASDAFGQTVDVTEEGYAIVGARQEDSNSQAAPANNGAAASGAVYIYERDGGGNWIQQAYLKHPSPTASDLFGIEVAISGNYAIVGAQSEDSDGPYAVNELSSASGAAFVFERSGGGVWSQNQFLKPFNQTAGDLFGTSVDIHEDQLLVGSTSEDSLGTSPFNEGASASGAGYIYEFDSGGWLGD
jgi:hypothetical protein